MKLIQVYEGRRIQFHALFQVFGLGNLCSRVRNIHISTKLQLKGKPLPVSGLIAQKKEAAASAVFCKNNRLRLVTLFQFSHPSISSTMLSAAVAFALQTLMVGCDRPYFRACDNPVTVKLFMIIYSGAVTGLSS